MLTMKQYYRTTDERIAGLFDRWTARCPVTGIELHFSGGRSRGLPKFFVFAPDHFISHYRDYKDWRYSSRACSTEEAIEKALNNSKVQGWYKQIWQREFNKLICD